MQFYENFGSKKHLSDVNNWILSWVIFAKPCVDSLSDLIEDSISLHIASATLGGFASRQAVLSSLNRIKVRCGSHKILFCSFHLTQSLHLVSLIQLLYEHGCRNSFGVCFNTGFGHVIHCEDW